MYVLVVILAVAAVADCASVTGTDGEGISLHALLERLETLESRHADEIQMLRVKHEEDIQRLTTRVENCERAAFNSVVNEFASTKEDKDEITESSQDAAHPSGKVGHQDESNRSLSARNIHHDNIIRTPTKRLFEGNNIAFSAYLDHDLNGVGADQIIVMNQVLLNDGNGYSPHTGVFTAPVNGVYSFSFFIGEESTNQIFVRLTVNSTPAVDAIADAMHTYHDAQGGNTANLKLSAGDAVMLKHTRTVFDDDTNHLEGDTDGRFSTFSGFLLYPTDNVQIVGK